MSNVDLLSLEASDMLDVIHYIFEDDLTVASEEQAVAKSAARDVLYEQFYGRPYKYKINKNGNANTVYGADGEIYDNLMPFDPTKESVSDSNPTSFGVGIDGPLN